MIFKVFFSFQIYFLDYENYQWKHVIDLILSFYRLCFDVNL